MRYRISEKLFSFADDFAITDEHGTEQFRVKGKIFTIGASLRILSPGGEEAARIEQKLLSWGPTYEIHRGGRLVAVVKKKLFTPLRTRFFVDVPGPDDLEAEGSFLAHEYEITRGGRAVATVSKKWFSWGDSYAVDVQSGEDEVLILATAIVIDLVCHPDGD